MPVVLTSQSITHQLPFILSCVPECEGTGQGWLTLKSLVGSAALGALWSVAAAHVPALANTCR